MGDISGWSAPLRRAVQRVGGIVAIPVLAGLHHQYVRICGRPFALYLWQLPPRPDMIFGRDRPHYQTVRLNTAHMANANFASAYQQPLCLRCLQPIRGACCCSMVDDSHQHAENAEAILKVAYCRDGVDVAVQAAIHMISIAAALLTSESGPDESRRILQIVGDAQGKAS